MLGWLDTRKFLQTRDAAASQGWPPLIVDTNGNGRRDAYVEPDQPVDPTMDTRVNRGFYAVMPNPADGSIWGSQNGFPGALMRVVPGPNPAVTALTEVFTPPLPGWGIRGADIDRDGVVWASLGSGHLASFDRRKCRGPLNGPHATGDHCPEGWEFHQFPGPGFAGLPDNSVESSYYTWVDQFNTSGLGENVPIATGNLSDGFHALADGRMVTLRVPYPMGYYAKGLDGRIDDPNAGWKGRGLWGTSGRPHALPLRGGQGNQAPGRPHPGETGPTGALSARARAATCRCGAPRSGSAGPPRLRRSRARRPPGDPRRSPLRRGRRPRPPRGGHRARRV